MRELSPDDVVPPLEPVGMLGSTVRALIEERGVTFVEETEYDAPGATQWALVALDSGAQFLLTHHYSRKPPYVVISGQVDAGTPATLCQWFAAELGLAESDFLQIAEDWPPVYPQSSS